MSYQGLYFDLEGQSVEREPMELADTIAVSAVLASISINGHIIRVSRHWVLVGNKLERVLVCEK